MAGLSYSKELPFNLVVSTLRRKKMIEMLSNSDTNKKEMNQMANTFGKLINRQKESKFKSRKRSKSKNYIINIFQNQI